MRDDGAKYHKCYDVYILEYKTYVFTSTKYVCVVILRLYLVSNVTSTDTGYWKVPGLELFLSDLGITITSN